MNDPHPKPLSARQIELGYSADAPTGSIDRAHRNLKTISWLERQPLMDRLNLRALYASDLGIPTDETVWLPEPMDDEALMWVFNRCANWINHP